MQRIHHAVQKGNLAEVKSLLDSGTPIDQLESFGVTPIMLAIQSGRIDIFQYLLERGANIHLKTKANWSCLTVAARFGDLELTKFFLQVGGFDIELQDVNGFTPLGLAATHGHTDVVEALLLAGANVNAVTVKGFTPLNSAAFRGNSDIIKLLLTKNADPNIKNMAGDTALTNAVEFGHVEVVRAVLEAEGIDIELGDRYGLTPLAIAASNVQEAIVELLIRHHANVETAVKMCQDHRFKMGVTMLVDVNKKVTEQIRIEKLFATLDLLRGDSSSYFFRTPRDLIEYLLKPRVADSRGLVFRPPAAPSSPAP